VTLVQALEAVDNQTEYRVAVNWDSNLDSRREITFANREVGIAQLLTQALAGTDHSWQMVDKMIVITHKTPTKPVDEHSVFGSLDIDPSRMTFVPDPYSRTQRPFEDMVRTRVVKMASDDRGRDSTGMATVHFRVNSTTLEQNYMDNAWALDLISRTFKNREVLASLDYIVITAAASPEGRTDLNEKLAQGRALALKSWIMWQFPFMDRDIIYTFSIGEEWSGLREMVDRDYLTPNRYEVLSILDSYRSNEAKKTALRSLGGGAAWRYLNEYMFPRLRGGVALSMHYKAEPEPRVIVEEKLRVDTVYVDRPVEVEVPVIVEQPAPEPIPEPVIEPAKEKRPLFALKTNLLFDAASLVNAELEIPLGDTWSLGGEWIFPWWLLEDKQYALEVGNANVNLKYWLGNRTTRSVMTGWFVGVGAGMGYYDLEWGDRGNQGEFWHAGVVAGFAHKANKKGTLRMEYSLGAGYLQAKHRDYVPKFNTEDNKWDLMYQKSGVFRWIGPTQARISLVWMLNRNVKKGGAK
jgi:hypothetical protein